MTTEPVEAGQWRYALGSVWAVIRPHPTRRGFWLCVNDEGPGFDITTLGRRELEAMRVVSQNYYGGRPHPGAEYAKAMESMTTIGSS